MKRKGNSKWLAGWIIYAAMIAMLLLMTLLGRAQPMISIGDKAPSLIESIWLTGERVSKFEPGQVYVVEFSTMGCAPCRAAIPHVSELAKRYRGRVTFINIYVLSNGTYPAKDTTNISYVAKLEHFVARMGDAIRYTVLADGPKQTLYSAWVKASGENGFPVTFIVDGNGIISWKGLITDLDAKMEQVVSGSNPILKTDSPQTRRIDRAWTAASRKDFKTAIQIYDSLISESPSDPFLYVWKLTFMLHTNRSEAYAMGWNILKGVCKDSEPALYYLARNVLTDENKEMGKDFDLVIAATERALILSRYEVISARILEEQAKAYEGKGDFSSAIKADMRAMAFIETYGYEDEEIKNVKATLKKLLEKHHAQSPK